MEQYIFHQKVLSSVFFSFFSLFFCQILTSARFAKTVKIITNSEFFALTVTSLFDKNMIDKSEDLKGKYMLLGRKKEKARLGKIGQEAYYANLGGRGISRTN